jgi:hypothetical protein
MVMIRILGYDGIPTPLDVALDAKSAHVWTARFSQLLPDGKGTDRDTSTSMQAVISI